MAARGGLAVSLVALVGCATKFEPDAAANIHTIAIVAPANPDGYQWPYNLRMFQSGPPAGMGVIGAAVGGFARGLATGVDRTANSRATITADDVFKSTDVKLGDELATLVADRLMKNSYQVVQIPFGEKPPATDAILTLEIGPLGYHCGGFFLEGECAPVLLTRATLKSAPNGKTLYARECNYGITARGCSNEADSGLALARLSDVLAEPQRSNAGIRVGAKVIADGIARDLASH